MYPMAAERKCRPCGPEPGCLDNQADTVAQGLAGVESGGLLPPRPGSDPEKNLTLVEEPKKPEAEEKRGQAEE